ncbi:MAG TPA: DNA-3-methyladenine glycosylase I, partial [Acidimicrobiales bacterium]
FDPEVVAGYDEPEIEVLLQDAGIIRHRGKIEATINNAGRALELIEECGSLDTYVWSWQPTEREPDVHDPSSAFVASSATSTALSKDLKKRGWKFVGPTTVYAFMQAMGLVDDHAEDCEWRRT